MDDAGAQLAADATQVRHVMQQGVDQRSRRVPGARVHHHPARLVDDDEIGVLVENRERDILRFGRCRGGRGNDDGNAIAGLHRQIGTRLAALDAHVALLDQPLYRRS